MSALFSVNSNSQLDFSEGHTVVISESVSDLLIVSPPCTTVNSEGLSDTLWSQSVEKSNGFSEDLLLVSSFISVNSESQLDASIIAIDESSQGIVKTSDRIWTSADFYEPGSVISTTVDSSSQIIKMVDVPGTIIVSNITCATPSYLPTTAMAEDMCYCDCFEIDLNPVVLQEKLDNILSNITVNIDQLSSTRREKTSAVDDRPTAISVGFFGILIITVVIAAIVFQDVVSLLYFLARGIIRKIKTGQFTESRKLPKKKKRKTEPEPPTKKETINPTSYTSLPDVENPEIVQPTVEQIPMVSEAAALSGRPNIPSSSKPKMAKPKNKPKVKRSSDSSLPSKGKTVTKISGVTRPIKKKTGTKKLVNVKAVKSNPNKPKEKLNI
ncbi:uncharacterized protein LOC126814454 [Patella vulgata]|uniref:uncharacterized protein LOC126814454 n=1 Tax=Patella vulgata TaxID=6465 RepID=UPI00217F76B6|nr:uncharacterized protein LOC126814454 [Patella vulgata]